MNDFLPAAYQVPTSQSNYMKFQDGENRFRILTSPILGFEIWQDTPEGGRKPVRRPMNHPFSVTEIQDGDPTNIKHFWAMPVWNYAEKRIQILEITQKGVQKSLLALTSDEDWGSPAGVNGYDIVVTKSGQKLETEYQVNPKPAKKLEKDIWEQYTKMSIRLEALYDGDDPFKVQGGDIAQDAVDAGL